MVRFLRRKLFEPIYFTGWVGSPMLAYWNELERTQYLSYDELHSRQWVRLKNMIGYAYEHNTFYRKRFESAGIHPDIIKANDDIAKIPILTKKEVQDNTSEMITRGFKQDLLFKYKTGGSTGKSLVVYMTEECSEMRNACARRHDRWSGWEVGEPIGAVWGNPDMPKSCRGKMKKWLVAPCIYLDTMSVSKESIKAFAQKWLKVKPSLLYGHAHSIYILAQYVRELSIDDIRPTGIISTSMMLLPHERKTIEEVFGQKVFDRYGCEEVSLIASECEAHQGMHLNIEHLYIEFIREDGTYANPGESGKIIVTDLINHAMPFIRYQVEDVGVPMSSACSCGRGLPLMKEVVGRTADFLVRKDGTKVAGVSLIENTLTKIPGIRQMQIVQERIDKIVINIVKGTEFGDSTDRALEQYFYDLFGKDVHIDLVPTTEIKPEASGKYRFSVCKISNRA